MCSMFTGSYEHTEEKDRLMREAAALREPFWDAMKEAWRRERLFRYLYWRRHGDHAARNFIQSWEVEDLQAEIAMWRAYATSELRDQDIVEELTALLERYFEMTWAEALSEGTSPLLAQAGMPVWHAATGSLLPATISYMVLYRAQQDPDPGCGWVYNYKDDDTCELFTLVLFDRGHVGIADGVTDERATSEFAAAREGIATMFQREDGKLFTETFNGPVIEKLANRLGALCVFHSMYLEHETADKRHFGTSFSLCGFRRHFLHLRYTAPAQVWHSEFHDTDFINRDIAEYVAHYR